ncbi:MAG: Nif11-like leader peptide family RiPP precursor [Proteocatella sp.]
MSIESAKAFRKKMEDDLEFVEKVNVIETLEELKAFILEEGYDFTVAEFKEANDAIYNKELNEDELENVVGGAVMTIPPIIKRII